MLLVLLGLMHNIGSLSILCGWGTGLVLVHNVRKVDPLVTSLVLASVLGGVGSRSSHRVVRLDTHSLLLLCRTDKHGWLAMSRA